MRKFLLLFIVISGLATQLSADMDPSIQKEVSFQLGGVTYKQAFYDANATMRLWEFTPEGQSLERWQNLVSIIQYRFDVPLDELSKTIMALIREEKGQWIGLKALGENTSVMAFILHDTRQTFSEVSVWLYKKQDGITIGYQLATRYYGEGHQLAVQEASKQNMSAWVNMLKTTPFPEIEMLSD